jgi:hypothetical protein
MAEKEGLIQNTFSKWKNWIWPVITDRESAKKAIRQGFWAAILAAILNVTFALVGISGLGALVDATFFAIIAFGIYQMSRAAALIGLVYYFFTRIGWWSSHWQNLWLAVLITVMFINSIRGTFAYYKFKMASPLEFSGPSKVTLLNRNLDLIMVVLTIGFLFWSYLMFDEMDHSTPTRSPNLRPKDQISLPSNLPPANRVAPDEITTKPTVDYFYLGNANLKKGKYAMAIENYSKAITINPPNASIYNYRGYAYSMRGQYDRAIADFTKAIKLNPHDAIIYNSRGNAYSAIGDVEKAIPDFEKACESGWADGCEALNSILKKR